MADEALLALIAAGPGVLLGAAAMATVIVKTRTDAKERAANAANVQAAKLAAGQAAEALVEASRQIVQTKDGVFEIGQRIDGRMGELLDAVKAAALSEGRAAGIAFERANPQSPANQSPAAGDFQPPDALTSTGPAEVIIVGTSHPVPVTNVDVPVVISNGTTTAYEDAEHDRKP